MPAGVVNSSYIFWQSSASGIPAFPSQSAISLSADPRFFIVARRPISAMFSIRSARICSAWGFDRWMSSYTSGGCATMRASSISCCRQGGGASSATCSPLKPAAARVNPYARVAACAPAWVTATSRSCSSASANCTTPMPLRRNSFRKSSCRPGRPAVTARTRRPTGESEGANIGLMLRIEGPVGLHNTGRGDLTEAVSTTSAHVGTAAISLGREATSAPSGNAQTTNSADATTLSRRCSIGLVTSAAIRRTLSSLPLSDESRSTMVSDSTCPASTDRINLPTPPSPKRTAGPKARRPVTGADQSTGRFCRPWLRTYQPASNCRLQRGMWFVEQLPHESPVYVVALDRDLLVTMIRGR